MNQAFLDLQAIWYQKLRDVGFEDIERGGFIKMDIHPTYKRLAFEEQDIREHYRDLAQCFLWEFPFRTETHRAIWACHVDGTPVRKIASLLGLTRNQVWPVIKTHREKLRVKYMEEITIRGYEPKVDYEFIKATWLNSYKHSSSFAKRIKHAVFYPAHSSIVDALLGRCRVLVATFSDEPSVILGYLVFEPMGPTIHYTFVKEGWRKLGIAGKLLEASQLKTAYFTHWTDPVDSLVNKKQVSLTYDPYRL